MSTPGASVALTPSLGRARRRDLNEVTPALIVATEGESFGPRAQSQGRLSAYDCAGMHWSKALFTILVVATSFTGRAKGEAVDVATRLTISGKFQMVGDDTYSLWLKKLRLCTQAETEEARDRLPPNLDALIKGKKIVALKARLLPGRALCTLMACTPGPCCNGCQFDWVAAPRGQCPRKELRVRQTDDFSPLRGSGMDCDVHAFGKKGDLVIVAGRMGASDLVEDAKLCRLANDDQRDPSCPSTPPPPGPEAPLPKRRGAAVPEPTQDAIAKVVANNKPQLLNCYERARAHDATVPAGTVDLTLSVGPSGGVRSMKMVTSTPALHVTKPCLERSVSRWAFPVAPRTYRTEFRVAFEP